MDEIAASQPRRWLFATSILLAIVACGLLVTWLFPAPPSRVPVGVGFKGGTYEIFFAQYRKTLAAHGVELEYRATGGAVANQKLLDDPASGVPIGFVQGGIENSKDAPDLMSLGRVAYQPFYLFVRADQDISDLTNLKGKRIAIGAAGNGSAVAAKKILAAAGVTAENSTFLPEFSEAAVNALREGKADAMFEAFSNEKVVREALLDARIKLISVRAAEALTRLFPFLSRVVLPQGAVDYERNVPATDITMISTTVGVLARKSLHPAIGTLLAQALQEAHGEPGLFHRAGEFPTHSDPEFPMAPAALDYYKNGPSFLNRYIPFWITNSAQRLLAVLIAVFGVILPIVRYVPQLRDWSMRRRFQRWYGRLNELDAELRDGMDPMELERVQAALDEMSEALRSARLPPGVMPQTFSLRGHIEAVRRRAADYARPMQSRIAERQAAVRAEPASARTAV
jgi:TRAP-type uncharacterized transport system substrate-binding protein